jgi:hypothetical protein
MRPALLALALLGLGGCSSQRASANASPPGYPPAGQWMGPPSPGPQTPQQPWGAPAQPSPWGSPHPAPAPPLPPSQPAPQPAPAAQPLPWPMTWQVPAGWPTIPGLPGWPGQAQPAPTPGQPSSDIGQRCVDTINRYRATKSLPPLARWVEAESCAASEAAEDARTQRAHGSFGRCQENAQNACPNWPGPAEQMIEGCLKMMWDEGPGPSPAHGHYNNMVDPRSTKVACGTITTPSGSLWSVQDFR